MTIIGTSYFVSFDAAARYYATYGELAIEVAHMVGRGEIHIGKPPIAPTERLVMLDGGKRYGIADDGPISPRQRWSLDVTREEN